MIIDGKKIAEEMLGEVAKELKKLTAAAPHLRAGVGPRLAAVLVSDRNLEAQPLSKEAQPRQHLEVEHLEVEPPSGVRRFLELKKKAAEKVGIDFRIYEFPAKITTQKLRKEIVGIAKAGVNHGVIVELPLPAHINTQYILNAIPPEKDPDVLSEKSQGTFFANRSPILPPAVEAVKQIFKYLNIEMRGKSCAVFGYGLLVGKPISHWLVQQSTTVSIINEFTQNPAELSRQADIIISGVGKPNLITAGMVKDGAVVIDFGYTTEAQKGHKDRNLDQGISSDGTTEAQNEIRNTEVKVMGDAKFDEVSKKAGWITPVPGGVGPIVVAAVLKNLVILRGM